MEEQEERDWVRPRWHNGGESHRSAYAPLPTVWTTPFAAPCQRLINSVLAVPALFVVRRDALPLG